MKRAVTIAPVLALLTSASVESSAETPRPAPPEYRAAPAPYDAEPAPSGPPLGHRGFQLAVRSGAAFPFGSAREPSPNEASFDEHWASSMRDLSGVQVPLLVDVGGKPDPHVFVGGYVGLAVGWTAGRLADACARLPLDCRSTTFRIGAEVHYVIAPHAWVTPWVGYGIGYSWFSAGDGQRQARLRGFELAHFLLGLDVRVTRTFGIGPFVDYAIGTFSHEDLSAGTAQPAPVDAGIADQALHHWLILGPRFVLYP